MDSLGEVGKKMRSAIKAKLVELGNASPTGYIDDELPDYVMIMVANKRSKQQMLTDLNLFLGSNTETFVTWLHQVLQKLQEVTLPTPLASKAKKKIGEAGKKDKKKDKKKSKEPSITDVIAVELMEKAKKTIDPKLKCEKKEKSLTPPPAPQISSSNSSTQQKGRDDDIVPTATETQKQPNSNILLRKEYAMLEDINSKIHEKQRKLITMSSSERNKEKSVEQDVEMREASPPPAPTISSTQQQQQQQQQQKTTSNIKSRLGSRPTENPTASTTDKSNIISLSAIRRSETEFLKKIVVKQKEDNDYRSSRNRSDSNNRSRRERRSPSRERYRNNREHRISRRSRGSRSRSPIKSRHEEKTRPSIRDRIGDRYTVTTSQSTSSSKKHSRTPEMEGNFKVKQRPALSSAITAHAGKNLLLRAMADAQKSTQAESRKKQQRDNIVVKVKNEPRSVNNKNDEEYVPESISGHSESEAEYHPSHKDNNNAANDDESDVVYLNNNDDVDLDDLDDNGEQPENIVVTVSNKEKSKSPTPPPVIKRRRKTPLKDRIGARLPDTRTKDDQKPRSKRNHHQVEEMEVEECESQRAYNKVKKARVSPIRFDLTDEECEDKSRTPSPARPDKKAAKTSESENGEAKRIRLETSRSFDHVPSLLSAVTVVDNSAKPIIKPKERCKFFPGCTNRNCTFFHPTTECVAFPHCKFGDSCMYKHPTCKFNTTCTRNGCNFAHTPILANSTPLVASSVVPAQNYKSITITPNMTICKFFPGCTNTNCIYQHPKICKFGKNCVNKYECSFWHIETAGSNKFKWNKTYELSK